MIFWPITLTFINELTCLSINDTVSFVLCRYDSLIYQSFSVLDMSLFWRSQARLTRQTNLAEFLDNIHPHVWIGI